MMTSNFACYCGSSKSFQLCCGVYLSGQKTAPTAEALMRSRYCAYVQKNIDYLVKTHAPPSGQVDRAGIAEWAAQVQWLGLNVIATQQGGEGDHEGEVEFMAYYDIAGLKGMLHERSRFKRIAGEWRYIDARE